jgi:hypothetical protein
MVYTDDVNLLGHNINTIQKNIEVLTDASRTSLELNAENVLSLECTANKNIVNGSFENVAKFKYLRMTVSNQNLIAHHAAEWLSSTAT